MKFLLLLFCFTFLQSCIVWHNSVPKVDSNPEDFIMLEDKISTHPRYLNGNDLHIIYQENYNDQDGKLEYIIYNQKQIVVQSNHTQTVTVKYGTNKINIPLTSLWPDIYVLEIINEKGVKKYLTFLKSF